MEKIILGLFISMLVSGCVSINAVPQDAKFVDFDLNKEGRTGWSKYEETMFIKNIDTRTAYLAAKAGLSEARFTIKKADFSHLVVIGEHGITPYDWNIVAGVYIKPEGKGCLIKAYVQGSKDIGFWGDMTGSSWTQDIFKGIRTYLNDPNTRNYN